MSWVMGGGLPRLKLNSAKTNIVCVGNSLTHGDGGNGVNGDYPTQMSGFSSLGGIAAINSGHSGARTIDIINNQAAWVDAFWVVGKTNVLNLWEGTNSIADYMQNGATASVACTHSLTDMTTLISNIQAVAASAHSSRWVINLITCLARENGAGQTQTDDLNASLDAYNAYLLANYRAMGAKGLCDIRVSGSVFNPPSYTMATWESWATSQGLFVSGEISGHNITHLNDAGYLQIANFVAASLPKLPAR